MTEASLAAAASPAILGAFFAALGAASYQEVRWRSTLNALIIAMAALAAAHLSAAHAYAPGAAAALPSAAMLAAVAAAMLGLLRIAGMYGTADWAVLASLFAVLLPAGLHLSVLSVLAGLALSCLHSAAVCAASNMRGGGVRARAREMSGGSGGWLGAAAAFVSCKRRSPRDRWAYRAGTGGGWGAPRRGILGGPERSPAPLYVTPSMPVLAHSCAASASLLAVLGP